MRKDTWILLRALCVFKTLESVLGSLFIEEKFFLHFPLENLSLPMSVSSLSYKILLKVCVKSDLSSVLTLDP